MKIKKKRFDFILFEGLKYKDLSAKPNLDLDKLKQGAIDVKIKYKKRNKRKDFEE